MAKKTAPLRRRLTAKQVAQRAGMAAMTLRSLEQGGAGVTMGAYLAVMQVLGIESDLIAMAQQDPLGRALQDARLSASPTPATGTEPTPPSTSTPAQSDAEVDADWAAQGNFISAQALAELLRR